MPEQIENRMVVDADWGEFEYGVPNKERFKKTRRIYEETEYGEDEDDEWFL